MAGGEDQRKRLAKDRVFDLLARISGILLSVYVLAKTVDTLIWINRTSPSLGFTASQYYDWKPFGTWILFAEIVLCGLVPALILLTPRLRRQRAWLIPAAALACCGVALNRYVQTVQTMALPTLSFDKFLTYTPSWQETGTFLGVLAYGVLVYSFSFRYFQIFPEERELKIEVRPRQEKRPSSQGDSDLCFRGTTASFWRRQLHFPGRFLYRAGRGRDHDPERVVARVPGLEQGQGGRHTMALGFHDLPAADRACRHVLTGEFKSRECPNAFDCRGCETHAKLVALHPPAAGEESEAEIFGMSFPLDRMYHRGHTWARPEADGTVTVGLDDLGTRLLGTPDAVDCRRPDRACRPTARRSAYTSARPMSAYSRRWMAKWWRPAA